MADKKKTFVLSLRSKKKSFYGNKNFEIVF